MSNGTQKLIEKFGLSILGERPQDVVDVLVPFTLEVLQRWGIPVDDYVRALRGGPAPTIPRKGGPVS